MFKYFDAGMLLFLMSSSVSVFQFERHISSITVSVNTTSISSDTHLNTKTFCLMISSLVCAYLIDFDLLIVTYHNFNMHEKINESRLKLKLIMDIIKKAFKLSISQIKS